MFNSSLRYHDTNRGQLRPTTTQPSIRLQGFGGHFKDAPPPFIEETKADNKIERKKKPVKKEKKKRKLKIKYGDI
tara:strand:- start:96 stop:320 length:225 start_codon:yes stop_codon:yes gene_type:complete